MPLRKKPWLGRFLLACLLCTGAPRSASADWTLTLLLGGARTQDSRLVLTQPAEATVVALSPVHFESESFEPPLYYGYRVGFFPRSRWIGVEGEFVHLKVIADTARTVDIDGEVRGQSVDGSGPMASVIERFSITHGVNLLLINVAARREGSASTTELPRWRVSGRFGVGASIPHAESTVGGVTLEGYEWGAFSLQGAAGLELRVAGPLSLTGEYKLTRTAQDVTIVGGTAQTRLVTHHAVFGAVVHIGRAR